MRSNLLKVLLLVLIGCSNPNRKGTGEAEMNSAAVYMEQHRPQFHFSPPAMWMNDPNGLVYQRGIYHLYYQHNPDTSVWGPMHWGHAVSRDLTRWEHKSVVMYPDEMGYIYSGSAVIDQDNSTGLGTAEDPPLIALFTHHDMDAQHAGAPDYEVQSMAYSTDGGLTLSKYADNPVLPNPGGVKDFRDPKVIWYEASRRWIMILAAYDHVKLFSSSNLKDWTYESDFGREHGSHGGVWECPDLFRLPTEDGSEKWVMLVSLGDGAPNGGTGTQYYVGDFDGRVFTSENAPDDIRWIDYGKDNYAGVTWSNIPEEDGRRIHIGWMSNVKYAQLVPTVAWRSAMTFPRSLHLAKVDESYYLQTVPVIELNALRDQEYRLESQSITQPLNITQLLDLKGSLFEIELVLDGVSPQSDFELALSNSLGENVRFGYTGSSNTFFIDRSQSGKVDFHPGFTGKHTAPRLSRSSEMTLRLLIDVASVEVFADDGLTTMTETFFPNEDFGTIKIRSKGDDVLLTSGVIRSLKPIW